MRSKAYASQLIGVTVIGSLMAACGIAPHSPGNGKPPTDLPNAHVQNAPAVMADAQDEDPELKLTAAQKTALKAIIQEHRTTLGGSLLAQAADLRKLIKAADLNQSMLVDRLKADRDTLVERIPQIAQSLMKIRAVLTPEQIAVLRDRLSDKKAEVAERVTNAVDQLELSSDQQAKLDKLRAKVAGRMIRHAMMTFLDNADGENLVAALKGAISNMPEPGVIADALTSLTPAQRQMLIDKAQEEEDVSEPANTEQFSAKWVRGRVGGYRSYGWGGYRAPYAYTYPTYTYAYTPWVTTTASYPIVYY